MYVYLDGKAPYDRDSLDRLLARSTSNSPCTGSGASPRRQVLDYFQKSRDTAEDPQAGGLPADGVPDAWIEDASVAVDASRRTIADPPSSIPPAVARIDAR